jgi:hypothetical protein
MSSLPCVHVASTSSRDEFYDFGSIGIVYAPLASSAIFDLVETMGVNYDGIEFFVWRGYLQGVAVKVIWNDDRCGSLSWFDVFADDPSAVALLERALGEYVG